MLERWLPIPDFRGYQISDQGNIRGRAGALMTQQWGGWKRKYRFINLNKDGKSHRKAVSRLVLLTFRGEPPPKYEARHKNGVHHDNRLDNLEWGTHSENMRDQRKHGTWWKTGRQSLTPDDVEEVHRLRATGMTQTAIAERMGVKQPQISRILNGKTWRFDPKPQDARKTTPPKAAAHDSRSSKEDRVFYS